MTMLEWHAKPQSNTSTHNDFQTGHNHPTGHNPAGYNPARIESTSTDPTRLPGHLFARFNVPFMHGSYSEESGKFMRTRIQLL